MSTDQTNPEDEEIGEEQLEDVAGGTSVFADGRGVNPKASASNTLAFPDVAGTPGSGGPPISIPYPSDGGDESSSENPPGSPSDD